ncbi:hypothetical protein F909_01150 [Acinetobacter sp. ANC 3929]|nr:MULTISPECIES: hypothetical protein [unclassified Acinetobacter]ENW82874.1 hypothetical protein F909_01150 [Acinetobacter sp. ANC 3929]MCH7350571.1 hypothetical protein [Acinetobacter sp. NIPH 2023]MCH7355179.1 hypothetical protein [Acinetobacter sp. NIPH 1958]MCH7357789.1 hypothetical protein [Acinetobacter sp. NIPH 2024]
MKVALRKIVVNMNANFIHIYHTNAEELDAFQFTDLQQFYLGDKIKTVK